MERKPQGPSEAWKPHERYWSRPYNVYNGKTNKLDRLTLEEFRAMPVEHLEPDYQYPYSTYMSYNGNTDTYIVRKAGVAAATADVSDRESSTSRWSSTLKQSSTSKAKNQDKGKSVAK